MPTRVTFEGSEFREILKIFNKFAVLSVSNPAITISTDKTQLSICTDSAFATAFPKSMQVESTEGGTTYSFNPTCILNLSFLGDLVTLEWESDTAPLSLQAGSLSTKLRVTVPHPEYTEVLSEMEGIKVPLGAMYAINKYLSIPFSFHTDKKELMPVTFKNVDGFLTVLADDKFSLAKITTNIPVEKDFLIKVPKYVIDCLYAKPPKEPDDICGIGVSKSQSMFTNNTIHIYSPILTGVTADFDLVIPTFKARTSCRFVPKDLSKAIKPLIGMIPKNNKEDTILTVQLSDKMSLGLQHREVGEGNVDSVEGITDIYNENSARNYKINMLPKAFDDYTKLLEVESGMMAANERMVYYQGGVDVGASNLNLNYIFPVVAL